MKPIRLAVFWHQHQPYYKDLVEGGYMLPWVRLHAIKDYYGMARLARKVPEFKHQINLVPSLLIQIQEYAAGRARDPWLEHTRISADSLDADQATFILDHFFMAQWENMIKRYARYGELLEKRRMGRRTASRALGAFSTQDLLDLQVWATLTWFHETAREDFPEIQALFDKGRSFTEQDKRDMLALQDAVIARVIPIHRELQDDGIAEITATPFYHPILPLLCDMESAKAAMPSCPMPAGFKPLPGDADVQVARAVERYEELFGKRPAGMWPSEGSVSEQAVGIMAKHGIRWLATDEEILERSLDIRLRNDAGELVRPQDLYRMYHLESDNGDMAMVFRDHDMSDVIGFKYFSWDGQAAADDLIAKIVRNGKRAIQNGVSDPIISIILDGENCWEHYANNGMNFLLAFYRAAAASPFITPVRIGDIVAEDAGWHDDASRLARLFPGSWINHDFYIWLGHSEDRRAWEFVFRVRKDLERFSQEREATGDNGELAQAWEELYIAEGSDWYWWYGDDHTSGNDEAFDGLFRTHLKNVYTLLEENTPPFLDLPILDAGRRDRFTAPREMLAIHIDGRTTNYFEWMGAGLYDSGREGGVMAESEKPLIARIHWGFDSANFFLRLDFNDALKQALDGRVVFKPAFMWRDENVTIEIGGRFGEPPCVTDSDGNPLEGARAAWDDILEVRIPFIALRQLAGDEVEFEIETEIDGRLAGALPRGFALTYTVPGDDFEAADWW